VIADRHVFVIRQQRIVGAEQLTRIGGVVDAGEKVGVVADRRRKLEAAIVGAVNEARPQRFDLGAIPAIGVENVAEAAAERNARLAAEREQRVEGRAASGLGGPPGEPIEQAELERGGEVEDLVPDRDAAAGSAFRRREYAQRQVLDRKVGVLIGRGDPAAPRR
jgi:hypothetical protein